MLFLKVVAAMPGWRDPSNLKWHGIVEAWNGVAYDDKGHRLGGLLLVVMLMGN